MADKNLLLGHGETLTYNIPTPKTKSTKKDVYSFTEAKTFLLQESKKLLEEISKIPAIAKPEGKAVVKLTLHPSYLAKSFYPTAFLRAFDLSAVGSKSEVIKPRKQIIKKPKESLFTSTLYIAGSEDSFNSFYEFLNNDNLTQGTKKDLIKIEHLTNFQNLEKIKSLGNAKKYEKYELVIHTPEVEREFILKAFKNYCAGIGVELDIKRLITTGGLTFIPAMMTKSMAVNVSLFTFLRTLRVMPSISIGEPVLMRSVLSAGTPALPVEKAIDSNLKVAVFDGGIGTNLIDDWCKEMIYPGGHRSDPRYLAHGADVTSTVLFGNIEATTTTLPRPYTNIDHYRVLDPTISNADPDLFDVLLRIQGALESKHYDYVNLSLGPRIPIEDDDVHAWTSTLEPFFATGKCLATVAVGNDGELSGQDRVQPPSDMVNALAIGASDTQIGNWSRASYSCIGPGRSPGLVKPDGLAFGGVKNNPFVVYSPFSNDIVSRAGTSFSSPLTLRTAIGINTLLNHNITPMTAKALIVHHVEKNKLPIIEGGWGRFTNDLDKIIYCADNQATVIYQGKLKPSQYLRAPIPFPDIELTGKLNIRATFCFATHVDPAHPVNYTRSGLKITFKPNSKEKTTKTFFSTSELYETEQNARSDAHKWETTLHRDKNFSVETLDHPCFDIVYHAREEGKPVKTSELKSLPYVLIVTVTAKNGSHIYNDIRTKYNVLQPIELKQTVQIKI